MELRLETPNQRVTRLRVAMGMTHAQFARHLGVKLPRLTNVENQGYPLGGKLAMIIAERCGVTLDWLYSGRTDTLSMSMIQRLSGTTMGDSEGNPGRSQGRPLAEFPTARRLG